MKYLEKIQTLLPLGYLYLILLGLLNESIQYYQLGINILNYSSVTDILLRPISQLFSGSVLIIIALSFFLFLFIIQSLATNYIHKNPAKKIMGKTLFKEDASKREIQKVIFPIFILFFAFELLSVFVGLGMGTGNKIHKAITQNKFECNYKINFSSGKTEEVYVFDLNSSYYFYVSKGSKNIMIVPLGTINSLEMINNKKLK